jgi:CelD/BcsL family acetyltransferase involved in cellulose biosynthesis
VALELLDPYTPQAERIWRGLESSSSIYFLRWAWIENWLACLPRAALPKLAVVEQGGVPLAAGFIGRRTIVRRGIVPSRSLFLNATGMPQLDELVIEHNGVVGPGSVADLVRALPGDWDELVLRYIDDAGYRSLAAAALPGVLRIDRDVATYHVDLAKVREHGYAALLGRSTRAQVRRAEKLAGGLALEVPRNATEALACYDELVEHHQRRWRGKGQPGAFADPWFDRFHRRLIERRYGAGEIQLLRLRAGSRTIGCLYNFVCGGRVLFYQSGVASPAHAHDKPGYLCHARAIEHSAAAGHAVYDLLGGDSRYKQSLATDSSRLVSVRIQRRRPWFQLEDALSRVLRSSRARSSS